jgi:hypothetical protein
MRNGSRDANKEVENSKRSMNSRSRRMIKEKRASNGSTGEQRGKIVSCLLSRIIQRNFMEVESYQTSIVAAQFRNEIQERAREKESITSAYGNYGSKLVFFVVSHVPFRGCALGIPFIDGLKLSPGRGAGLVEVFDVSLVPLVE